MRHDPSIRSRRWLLAVGVLAGLVGLAAGASSAGASSPSQRGYVVCPACPPWYPYPNPCDPAYPPIPGLPTPAPRPTPTPGPASALTYNVCRQMTKLIPAQVQADALANPHLSYGYGLLRNPNVPYHPLWNTYRNWLTLRNPNVPWSRCNPAVWKAGCP